jgi:hypothetical protein
MQQKSALQTYERATTIELTDAEQKKRYAVPRKADTSVRWLPEPDDFRFNLTYWLTLAIAVGLFFVSQPSSGSPLITSYLDVLDKRSAWAIPGIVEAGGYSFLLSLLFIIFFTVTLFLTYIGCVGSRRVRDTVAGSRETRYFGLGNLANNIRGLKWVFLLYVVMLISNVALFYFYKVQLDKPEMVQTGLPFRFTYFFAIISRLIGVFVGLGALIHVFLEDFGQRIRSFLQSYATYFYPPLIAIGIVFFVFTRMDQFDGLFIDLVSSWGNFLLFSLLLFPASIAIIWFTPSYLYFTDRQFANREDSWDILERLYSDDERFATAPKLYWWTLYHKRLFPQLDELPDKPIPPDFMVGMDKDVAYPREAFERFRAFLGAAYILTLIHLCARIYFGNQAHPIMSPWVLTGATAVAALAYVVISLWVTNRSIRNSTVVTRKYEKAATPEKLGYLAALRERARQKRKPDGSQILKDEEKVIYVGDRRPFLFGFFTLIVALLLFTSTSVAIIVQASWHTTFLLFLCFLVTSVFSFSWLAFYQPFYRGFTYNRKQSRQVATVVAVPGRVKRDTTAQLFPNDLWLDRIDHLTTQAMLLINPLVFLLSLAFFLVGLFWEGWVASSFVAWLNPLNVYLLLVNGLIAAIILFDRFLLLRDRRRQYLMVKHQLLGNAREQANISSANYFWGLAIIVLLLAGSYLGNSYHEIQYYPTDSQPPSLREYTENFLKDNPSDGPVIFVASDGGGLKACYWTMLNLLQLDRRDLYTNNVFALSGASGGTIGLSMYNYLKARGKTIYDIKPYIDRIGSGNYLSGDFAGLLTRFPINYWPDLPGLEPHRWDDRMEGMEDAYFRIVGEDDGNYAFDKIRQLPFWYPWADGKKLPLLIVNTARAEDGLLGTVVPLDNNPLVGTIDLTRQSSGNIISYPDATFLSNRFPVASPAARITGKGHFLDAGNADNSGISSLYSLIRTMKSEAIAEKAAGIDGPFSKIFARGVIILSLRNAASRYVRDEYLWARDSFNRYPYKSEISANAGVAVNTGLTGVPTSWDDYLRDTIVRKLDLVHDFYTINLPFRLREADVFSSLGGELKIPGLDTARQRLNREIYAHLGVDSSYAVMPPLGRLLAKPVLEYMDRMVTVPKNWSRLDSLATWRKAVMAPDTLGFPSQAPDTLGN